MTSSRQDKITSDVEATWGRASDFSQSFERDPKTQDQEVRDEITQETNWLPFFMASLFATTLEDIIAQLYILFEINSELRILKMRTEMLENLARKYGVKQKTVIDELDDIDPKKLGCLEYKLKKLQSDRLLVLKILQDTYLDLSSNCQYNALYENVNRIRDRQNHLKNLIEVESNNRILRRELNRQLRQQRNHIKSITYDTNIDIELLKTNLEDAELNSEIRSRYVLGWQRARTEQHVQMIYDKELMPNQTIEYLKMKADQEQRVHTEIELLNNIRINEVLVEVEHWMGKYDKDIERMDLKVQLKKNDYEYICDKRLELEETLVKHEESINNWKKFNEEREADRQYRENMFNAATTVQAWWRGFLVRQQLGPYKVVKKKGPAPKPEEKSGKKKK
ncbi:dynein regulatory complex protein 9-like [Vanessa atalanta]|uniref:dynein regulatory complex protein 9-like n=1 Tax=Vanessa atalanta TaxID=42275 RepID=UPI001FCD1429|nr:dynein regulatory complex protein 9-like [Vanessa atalanta]